MTLKLHNTLTRKVETFKPLRGAVRMYTCGPTVYNYAHIGNLRTFTSEDVLKRYLKWKGFKIKHVRNLTDVDDKTIRGSKAEGVPLKEFTEKYTRSFFEDLEALNIEQADVYPKATEHIKEMVSLIRKLLKSGKAYVSDDGSVYYSIDRFRGYGKLSKVDLTGLQAGARVKQDQYEKEEAKDFALWKAWVPGDGDVYWETEIGKGRPGWHIECSAMAMKHLGATLDLHSGGKDLMFPHHENEIAQSEGVTGKTFVKHWMHAEHLLVDGKKMSKSLGNFYTLRDVLARGHSARAVRYFFVSAHYRAELNFTFGALAAAEEALRRLDEFVARLKDSKGKKNPKVNKFVDRLLKEFEAAMDDDLNTPKALAAVFDFVRDTNKLIDVGISQVNAKAALKALQSVDKVFGIFSKDEKKLPAEAKKLIQEREAARKAKNYKRSDEIRDLLKSKHNVEIQDTPEGPKVR